MNLKIFWIALAVALVIGIGAYWFFSSTSSQTPDITTPNGEFPNAGNAQGGANSGSLSVAEIQEGSIMVHNFKSDITTVADPTNKGVYYLAGGASPALSDPPYQIMYDETHQYFAIALYQEPLGSNRKEAEQFLQKELGLANADMCKLNYFVGVGKGVNDFYLAKNLGFSFCPGATELP